LAPIFDIPIGADIKHCMMGGYWITKKQVYNGLSSVIESGEACNKGLNEAAEYAA